MITEKTKLLIDCDPGVDDSVALLFALAREDAEIVGIATGTGNTSAAQGADNARRLLKLVGKDHEIPVCIGAEQPLVGEHGDFPAFIHGDNGLGNITLPESDAPFDERNVCDFLYEIASEHAGEVVLITLGRFTNIANTIKKYPDCLRMQGGNPPTLVYFKRNAEPDELMQGAVKVMQQVVQEYLEAANGD